MSVAMYLYPEARITDPFGAAGHCAVAEHIRDQRYVAAEMPGVGAHVSVLTYTLLSPDRNDACNGLNDRTVAVVDIVEAKAREQKMVTVQTGENGDGDFRHRQDCALRRLFRFQQGRGQTRIQSHAGADQVVRSCSLRPPDLTGHSDCHRRVRLLLASVLDELMAL